MKITKLQGQGIETCGEDEPDPVGGSSLTRRRLLQVASAGAAVHAFGGAAFAQGAAPEGQVLPLSVGYLEDSDLLPSLKQQPWRQGRARGLQILPADRMSLGDQSLAHSTVEMRVHGFYPGIPPRRLAPFTTAVLTVFFPSFDPLRLDPLPYYSWQGKLWPGPQKGSPNRFLVPLREDGGLELVLEVFDGFPTAAGQRAARVLRGGNGQTPISEPLELKSLYTDFTVDWYGGRPKLQRGFYFLGLAPGTWSSPGELPGAIGWKGSRDSERWSLVVSFDRVEEDDPRLQVGS